MQRHRRRWRHSMRHPSVRERERGSCRLAGIPLSQSVFGAFRVWKFSCFWVACACDIPKLVRLSRVSKLVGGVNPYKLYIICVCMRVSACA